MKNLNILKANGNSTNAETIVPESLLDISLVYIFNSQLHMGKYMMLFVLVFTFLC